MFPEYDGDIFIVDYEDIIFLTPNLRNQLKQNHGLIPNSSIPSLGSIGEHLLQKDADSTTIFYEAFIRNNSHLIRYEINYQKSIGNNELAINFELDLLNKQYEILSQQISDIQQILNTPHISLEKKTYLSSKLDSYSQEISNIQIRLNDLQNSQNTSNLRNLYRLFGIKTSNINSIFSWLKAKFNFHPNITNNHTRNGD